jgi:lactoylglutathione lyase
MAASVMLHPRAHGGGVRLTDGQRRALGDAFEPAALRLHYCGASKEETMSDGAKPKLVGINHVAIEVGNIDEGLDFYGKIFDFTLRGRSERSAFIDIGDQFINMTLGPAKEGVERRHIGFVVDDRSSIIARAKDAGARMVEGRFLDFLDPWGNRIEVVQYDNVQFTKAPHVLRGMGLDLAKTDNAKKELAAKGMGQD